MPVLGSIQQRDNRRGKRHLLLWCASTCHTVGFQVALGYQIVSRLRVGLLDHGLSSHCGIFGQRSHASPKHRRIRVVRKRCATITIAGRHRVTFISSRLTSVDLTLTCLTIPTITPISSPGIVAVVVIVVALRSSSLLRLLRF